MNEPKEFHTEAAAQAAVNQAIKEGKADYGHTSGPFTGKGGRLIYRAHVEKDGTGWCLRD